MNALVMDNNVLPVDFMNLNVCESLRTISKLMKIECVFKVCCGWMVTENYSCVNKFDVINR